MSGHLPLDIENGEARMTFDDLDAIHEAIGWAKLVWEFRPKRTGIDYLGATGEEIRCCTIERDGGLVFHWPRAYSTWAMIAVEQAVLSGKSKEEINAVAFDVLSLGMDMEIRARWKSLEAFDDALYEYEAARRMILATVDSLDWCNDDLTAILPRVA